jgi:hypothetical protein
MYNNGHWGYNGWAPRFAVCDENTSVHSALSGDSYPFGYPPQAQYDPNFHGMYPMQYYQPHHTPEHSVSDPAAFPPGYYPPNFDPYNPEHALAANSGWYGYHDPNMMYGGAPPTPQQQQQHPEEPDAPSSPGPPLSPGPQDASIQTGLSSYETGAVPEQQQTPYKCDYSHAVPMSPFWGHMEYQMHSTLAMTGIVTPHKAPPPPNHGLKEGEEIKERSGAEEIEAQPLLINQPHYYPYGSAYGEGYVPPSPATQFMMSPQANSQAAAYYAAYNAGGYNHGYYHSPRRVTQRRRQKRTPPRSGGSNGRDLQKDANSPPPVIRKANTATVEAGSDSEHTAATTTESDSVPGS